MKKLIIGIVVLVLVAVGGGALVSASQAASTAATPSQAMLPPVKAEAKIVAEAKVVPETSAALAFPAGGIVAGVLTAPGQLVEPGQVLVQLDTGTLELQLAEQEANLAAAQARSSQLENTPSMIQVQSARQNLAAAEAAYDNLLHPSAGELAALKADVDKSKALLDQATAAYDRVGGDGNVFAAMLPQRAQMQTAWLDYTRALALYDARVNPTDAEIQQALADVQNAKNEQARLQPTVDELAEAEANAAAAQAARDLAADQLRNARLAAPIAGTVVSVEAKVGEYVTAGISILQLADVSAWQIETTDLTELDIDKIREGMLATITFDAIPGLELPGKVSFIKLYGENRQGDIVYTVVVTPDQQDARLRWNMTAKVNFDQAE